VTLVLWRPEKAGEERREVSKPDRFSRSSRHLWSVLLLLLLPLAAATILIWGDMPIDARPDNDGAHVAGFALFALVGGGIINLVRSRSRDDWFVLGMATAYAAAILAAMCLAVTQTPALSLVRVHVPEHGLSGAETLLGGYPRRHLRKAGGGPLLLASLQQGRPLRHTRNRAAPHRVRALLQSPEPELRAVHFANRAVSAQPSARTRLKANTTLPSP
jgi:hypothetical protein